MPTKTISLRIEAYERLRRARLEPSESFSDVVMRAVWSDLGMTGREFLALYEQRGAYFSAQSLDRVEEADASDATPPDKWAEP